MNEKLNETAIENTDAIATPKQKRAIAAIGEEGSVVKRITLSQSTLRGIEFIAVARGLTRRRDASGTIAAEVISQILEEAFRSYFNSSEVQSLFKI